MSTKFVREQSKKLTAPHPIGTYVRNHANKNAWIGVVEFNGSEGAQLSHNGKYLPPLCVDVRITHDRFGDVVTAQRYVIADSAYFEVVAKHTN